MSFEQPPVFKQETQEDKDKKIAENLQSKLEKINSFEPSGDIANDFNEILELTGRDSLYKKVSADENPHVILAGLTGIKTAWQETLRDPNNVDVANEAKKLFYIDVPQAEIEAVNRLINFYLDKFSAEQEKNNSEDENSYKVETPAKPATDDSEGLASRDRDLEEKQAQAKKRDEAKIAEIRASLGLEQTEDQKATKQHLQEYLGLKEGDVERVSLLKAKNLPEQYQEQREALHDERLGGITIAVVPDDLWVKGSQPSESSAENQLILIKQSYFEAQENPDEIAWLCHELAHCQNFLDSKSPEEYQGNMQRFAFEDLKTEYSYPNNPVEQYTFTKQFQYLKEQGKSRKDVLAMLGEHYEEEDFPFFNRLLDGVYGK